ncbi:MAG: NAD(P)H-hydrate dehydratase [Solirubrobacterales bacterium]
MAEVDRWAIEQQSVPSLELMEAAGHALAEASAAVAKPGPVTVVCGKGNNGGDGMVAARHLVESGYEVQVILLWEPDALSPDATTSFQLLAGAEILTGQGAMSRLAESGVIIDAMLGTGFDGEPRSPVSEAIEAINAAGCPVVSCDVPSGVNASTGEAGLSVKADRTVTFHGLKVGHLISPGKHLCGAVTVAGIGIPSGAPEGQAAGRISTRVLDLLPPRGAASNKFTSGKVSIVGGSRGLTGAVCLAARAAIRSGAGYATAAVPQGLESVFEAKLTETMTIGCGTEEGFLGPSALEQVSGHCENASAVVLGSGLGREPEAGEFLRDLVVGLAAPVVVDADGLGGLDGRPELVRGRPGPTVLTPHEGEMSRLLGRSSGEVAASRLDSALSLARESGAVVVLKGDDTIVTDGERIAVNDCAAPALATAGTGDVLAGVCGAFLARGLEPFDAACAAVLCHSRAGQLAAARVGSAEGVIAGDVVEAMPLAMVTGPIGGHH